MPQLRIIKIFDRCICMNVRTKSSLVFRFNSKQCLSSGEAMDLFDAILFTIPQKRGSFLGSTIMMLDPARQYYNSSGEALVPLFVSDPGATINPNLPFHHPHHNLLRSYLTQHFLGGKKNRKSSNVRPMEQRKTKNWNNGVKEMISLVLQELG